MASFADGDFIISPIYPIREAVGPGMSVIDIARMEHGMAREHREALQEIRAVLHKMGHFSA